MERAWVEQGDGGREGADQAWKRVGFSGNTIHQILTSLLRPNLASQVRMDFRQQYSWHRSMLAHGDSEGLH